MNNGCDNDRLLCQDCSRPLFRWFLSRIDWRRTLKLNNEELNSQARALYERDAPIAPTWDQLGEVTRQAWRDDVQSRAAAAGAPAVPDCETCHGEGTIDERLGGYSFSNPAATCPDCDGAGEGPAGVREAATYRLLEHGEAIQKGDECLRDDAVTWGPIAGWEIGMQWGGHLMPLRRRTDGVKGFHCARQGMCDVTPRCTVQCAACAADGVTLDAPTEQGAYDLGAKGAPATERERLLFEAWMRGHCWALCATWDGKQYRSDAEQGGDLDPRAMATRRLFAAWRDRAALGVSGTLQSDVPPSATHGR